MRENAFSRAASSALAYERVTVASGPAAGAAAAAVLDALIGPNLPFQHTSTTAPAAGPDATVTRSYASADDAARENAFSRMLVGIHFRRACTAGLQQGRDVARYVLAQAPFLHD